MQRDGHRASIWDKSDFEWRHIGRRPDEKEGRKRFVVSKTRPISLGFLLSGNSLLVASSVTLSITTITFLSWTESTRSKKEQSENGSYASMIFKYSHEKKRWRNGCQETHASWGSGSAVRTCVDGLGSHASASWKLQWKSSQNRPKNHGARHGGALCRRRDITKLKNQWVGLQQQGPHGSLSNKFEKHEQSYYNADNPCSYKILKNDIKIIQNTICNKDKTSCTLLNHVLHSRS